MPKNLNKAGSIHSSLTMHCLTIFSCITKNCHQMIRRRFQKIAESQLLLLLIQPTLDWLFETKVYLFHVSKLESVVCM